MSLTSFLESSSTLRAKLRTEFRKPDFRIKAQIKAPPLTVNYGLVGRAFDYLLRFYVQKINRCAVSGIWVAESGLNVLEETDPNFKVANQMFSQAQTRYADFMASRRRRPTRELAEAAVILAHLELIYRAGIVDPMMFEPAPPAVLDDLEAMLDLVRPSDFRAARRCVLNPTFGWGSALVGGADADLIIDDLLIDFKTNKHLTFDREIFNQLVGYYLLSCVGGVDNCRRGVIRELGVYFARYGILHRVRVSDCIKKSRMPHILKWFNEYARETIPD